MVCVFYEPAYVGIGQWFGERQGKPLGLLTLVAGLSVTVFLPLTQWLVGLLSWRGPDPGSRPVRRRRPPLAARRQGQAPLRCRRHEDRPQARLRRVARKP